MKDLKWFMFLVFCLVFCFLQTGCSNLSLNPATKSINAENNNCTGVLRVDNDQKGDNSDKGLFLMFQVSESASEKQADVMINFVLEIPEMIKEASK